MGKYLNILNRAYVEIERAISHASPALRADAMKVAGEILNRVAAA